MMLSKYLIRLNAFFLLVLTGCGGVGVVATSDPLSKLNDSYDLAFIQDRPIPAQRLIFEAMDIYKTQGDDRGLGLAYRNYADLLKSNAVGTGKQSKAFKENGFMDKSITFDNRLEKSKQYYSMAIELLTKSESATIQKSQYDILTNTYFNIATSYSGLDNLEQSCLFYDKALGAYQENIKLHPQARPNSAKGSIPEYVAAKKKQQQCPTP